MKQSVQNVSRDIIGQPIYNSQNIRTVLTIFSQKLINLKTKQKSSTIDPFTDCDLALHRNASDNQRTSQNATLNRGRKQMLN